MANTLIIRFYCPFRKPFIYKGRIVENPQMKQRRRGGNSKTNVQLSRTRARGAEATVRARPAELAPAAHGWAGARPGRPGGGAGGGSCASVTRGDPGSVPSSPPALRARRSVPLANHGAAAGSSRARGSPWFPSPAVGRRCSRRASWGGRRVPRRVSGHPSAHVALGHSTLEPPWGVQRGPGRGFCPRAHASV